MEAKKFSRPEFLSEKQFAEHIKLYEGYVKKTNEIFEKLKNSSFDDANATLSEVRSLKQAENFAISGAKLHELYFSNIGSSNYEGKVKEVVEAEWGFEKFKKRFIASSLSVRGWVILAFDYDTKEVMLYGTDSHDNAIWNCIPLLVLDVYEHAYFLDYGTDRKKYVEDFFNNINWKEVNKRLEKIK